MFETSDSRQRRKTPTRWSPSVGLAGVVLWMAFLGWAFVSYPAMDNLAVGWIVWVLTGLPGLEAMSQSVAIFCAVLLGETMAVFAVFFALGAIIDSFPRA